MFKSVFAKYVTVVMSIFAGVFAVLLVVLTSIIGNLLSDSKATAMDQIGTAAAGYLSAGMGDSVTRESFGEAVEDCVTSESLRMSELFASLLATEEDMELLISDHEGRLLMRFSDGVCTAFANVTMPLRFSGFENGETEVVELARVEFLYEGDVLLYTTVLRSASGEIVGYLSVSSTLASNARIMSDLISTVLSAACLVLLAAMIAIYLISERVTSPLREMSSVARKMAKGEFGSRVRVQGRDEVAELALAFNHMADSLENLEKMRASFVANVSHDLRTPMTAIAGFIDGIRDGVIPPEERDHYLEVISQEVKRLSRLVSTLLDLSRIQAGDRKFVSAPFDICEMGRLILISFEQRINEKQLDVEFFCENDRITVFADRDAIYQVFYNITHNAIKFADQRGRLRIGISEKGRRAVVSVYNDGQCIPQEDLPHVFERFYKSDKSRGLDKNGVGLGLYISKTIVEAHGESIGVSCESGTGCEFSFTLPTYSKGN